jgi:hypothetical protein
VNNELPTLGSLTFLTASFFVKWFLVIGLLMYSFFATVVVKQVGIMSETVDSDLNPVVKIFARLHLLLSVLLLAVALLFL